jgi:MFS family permease
MSDKTIVNSNPSNRPVNVMATLAPMILIVFFGVLAIGIPLPTLAIYVGTTLGFSSATAGWLIGTQSIATILSRHASGSFSDRRGPKTAVILGLLLAAFAGCLYLLSTLPMLHDLVRLGILFIGRVTLGIAESLFITGALSWSITRAGAQNTVRAMSWQGISMYAALGVGAVIGLQVLQVWHFQAVAIVTIITPLAALLIAICVKGVPPHPGTHASFFSVIRLIWRPGLIQAFATVPYAGLSAFLALHYHSENWSGAALACWPSPQLMSSSVSWGPVYQNALAPPASSPHPWRSKRLARSCCGRQPIRQSRCSERP